VRAIITFNLDHLLQIYTKARYRTHLLRTIERASASRSHSGRLPIYHMHGMLRFDEGAGDPSRESPDSVVLTEQDYFDFFDSPNRLFNYTFLYFLREFRCLFVGLSMQDANMRRLLHYSKRERMHGYRQEGAVDRLRRRTRHFAILPSMVDPAVDGAAEMGLEPLGVDCLWIEDFNEIPEVLGDLYAAGGHDWGPVWNEPARLVQP
jgi:hypothetical protein